MKVQGHRDPEKEKKWRAILQHFQTAGLSGNEFCRREGLNPNTLQYWKKELKARDELAGKKQKQSLVPVRVVAPAPVIEPHAADFIEIVTSDGLQIRVPLTCDAEIVGELMAGLRGTRC